MSAQEYLEWQQQSSIESALWLSEHFTKIPSKLTVIDDQVNADTAYRLACEGHGLLWQGDFQNAKQLLQAMGRRFERGLKAKSKKKAGALTTAERFHQYRLQQAQRAAILNQLLIQLSANGSCALKRTPDTAEALQAAFGLQEDRYLLPLRALQGALGAYQWRLKGVEVKELQASVYPRYGVFAPVRSEYLALVEQACAELKAEQALDIGTGTGVIAAMLAKQGVPKVLATDINPAAIATAKETIQQLGYCQQVQIIEADLFPDTLQSYDLIVCNPPWLPGKASSALEFAVYDHKSRMLKQVLQGGAQRLNSGGQLWIIISDLAEHLQLRTRTELLHWIEQAGLRVIKRLDTQPSHRRSHDQQDAFYHERSQEITSLWVLGTAK